MKDFSTRAKIPHHVLYRAKRCQMYYEKLQDVDFGIICRLERESTEHSKVLVRGGFSKLFSDVPSVRIPGPKVSCNFLDALDGMCNFPGTSECEAQSGAQG